ncbi:hypothetical protein KCU77_g2765, partial [Aureobasidium melanogenum]
MVKLITSWAIGCAAILLACCAHVTYSWAILSGAVSLVAYQEKQGAEVVNGIYRDCVLRHDYDNKLLEKQLPCAARALYWMFKSGLAASSAYAIVDAIRSGFGNAQEKSKDELRKRSIAFNGTDYTLTEFANSVNIMPLDHEIKGLSNSQGYTIYSNLTGQHMMDIFKNDTHTHTIIGSIAPGSRKMRKRDYLDTENNWFSFGDEAGIKWSARSDYTTNSVDGAIWDLAFNFVYNQAGASDVWKVNICDQNRYQAWTWGNLVFERNGFGDNFEDPGTSDCDCDSQKAPTGECDYDT